MCWKVYYLCPIANAAHNLIVLSVFAFAMDARASCTTVHMCTCECTNTVGPNLSFITWCRPTWYKFLNPVSSSEGRLCCNLKMPYLSKSLVLQWALLMITGGICCRGLLWPWQFCIAMTLWPADKCSVIAYLLWHCVQASLWADVAIRWWMSLLVACSWLISRQPCDCHLSVVMTGDPWIDEAGVLWTLRWCSSGFCLLLV